MEELKEHYVKKTTCYLLVFMALFIGCFVGNAITMLYVGQRPMAVQQSVPSSTPQASVPNPTKLAALEGAAQADPTNVQAWVQLGHYCFDNDLPGKAVTAYEHVLELRPRDVSIWSDLGVMYRRTGRYQDAIRAFTEAGKLDPKHIVSRFNMGIVYLHDLNDRASALKVWKEVLSIDPNAKAPSGKPVADLVKEME